MMGMMMLETGFEQQHEPSAEVDSLHDEPTSITTAAKIGISV